MNFGAPLLSAFLRLNPKYLIHNPVLFVTYIASIVTTFLAVYALYFPDFGSAQFITHIAFWLWFTVLFSNFSECIAEKRGKAQAETLKKSRRELMAKKISHPKDRQFHLLAATDLQQGDLVFVEAQDVIPSDGKVIDGIATIDESAVTGESAPVIRESGHERSFVTGGTLVLSDWLVIEITTNPGENFLDKMIALVEGAKRQKSPNEIALTLLLAGMTLVFLSVVLCLPSFSIFYTQTTQQGSVVSLPVLIALLICLIPTTIGGLLSAIGIAGMDRLIRCNVIATSGRAVEAAGDINVVLLDKTGTITIGNREAVRFIAAKNVSLQDLAQAAFFSSLSDDTPEGKSIVKLAGGAYGIDVNHPLVQNFTFIPFSAETRMSGVVWNGKKIFKGATDKIVLHIQNAQGFIDDTILKKVEEIARTGSTPLVVTDEKKILGIIELKDVIKPGIKARLSILRTMGIKSIMITGDNPLTAATIALEAGVDDFYAEATPEKKLLLIKEFQQNGQLVAMVGDGSNDAPALAQTDVAVAMNSGTQAAKEASNMIDLDSDPTKLIEIVAIGKQLLMTRGALTTFSITNDIAKYFAIIPAAFSVTLPSLNRLNFMHLHSPSSAVLSAVIFNALIIVFLIPIALRGVKFRPVSANLQLLYNVLIYGLGGLIVPFVGIKIIDLILQAIQR